MSASKRLGWILTLLAALGLVGCSDRSALGRRAEETYGRLRTVQAEQASAAPAACLSGRPVASPRGGQVQAAAGEGVSAGKRNPILLFAPPAEPSAPPPGGTEQTPGGTEQTSAAVFPPVEGTSFGEVLKVDLRAAPEQIWSGTKYSFANVQNLTVLSLAFGADRIVRNNLDRDVRDHFRDDRHGSLSETGDFGSVIGNPALHFGIAGVWYAVAVRNRDAKNHTFSKVMMEALAVNGLSTVLLKVSMNDRSPNGEYYGWPSGHLSSSVCFASVIHEYYGWKSAVPLYLLAGYSGATRLQDREHDLSDLVFGAALGWVIGHSVVKGELPQVGGFYVLPYGGPEAGGLMLLKEF